MGLFRYLFGYNQRTFEKNTLRFSDMLQTMMDEISSNRREMLYEIEIHKNLYLIANAIKACKYTPEKRDLYKRVDEEILERIYRMYDAVRGGRYISLSIRSWFLFDCVVKGRFYGENTFSSGDRDTEHTIAESAEKIYAAILRDQDINDDQKKILNIAANVDEAAREKCRLQYMDLEDRRMANLETIRLLATSSSEAMGTISPDMLKSAIRDIPERYPTFDDYYKWDSPVDFLRYIGMHSRTIVDIHELPIIIEYYPPPANPNPFLPSSPNGFEKFLQEGAEAKLNGSFREPDPFERAMMKCSEDEKKRNTDIKEMEKTESGLDDSVDKQSPFQTAWAKYTEDKENNNTNS